MAAYEREVDDIFFLKQCEMLMYSEVYLYTDQPTTCPKCGLRTDILLDLTHTIEKTQLHKCLSKSCSFEFVVEVGLNDN